MPLPYVGPVTGPDKSTVGHRKYVSDAALRVLTEAQADARIQSLLSGYATRAEVDAGDAGAVSQSYVQTQDALRIPLSWKGVPNGTATLTSGKVTSGQVTLTAAQRFLKKMYSPSAYHSATRSITTGTYSLYTVSIADPGYSYRIQAWGYCDTKTSVTGAHPVITVRIASSTGTIVSRGYGKASSNNWSECTFVPIGEGTVRTGATTLYVVGSRAGSTGGTIEFSNSLANIYVQVIPA